jgi:nucleoside-diphosphate-sugar epimerase
MKVLFIGGSGIISSACSALAVESGIDLFLLNRGQTSFRPIPAAAHVIHADIRDPAAATEALRGQTFDAVVDWIAFTPDHVAVDLALFRGRVGQFVFISSASAYQKPPQRLPITEETPLDNPFWQYSRNKIACEELLMAAYRTRASPPPSSARRTPTTPPCCPSTAATPRSTGCGAASRFSSTTTANRCGR